MFKGQTVEVRESGGVGRYWQTLAPYTMTLLRVLVGVVFLLNGLAKVGNVAGFTGFVTSLGFPLPGFVAIVVIALEAIGGFLLIVGLGTHWLGLLFALEMLVTTLVVKFPNQGFLPPQGQPGTGAVYDMLLLVGALVLMAHGSGPLSVERDLLKREL